LERDSKDSDWLPAIRGERAGYHVLFEDLRTGKAKMSDLAGGNQRTFGDWLQDVFPGRYLKQYPEFLRHMNKLVAIAELPIHERGARIDELDTVLRDMDRKHQNRLLILLVGPAFKQVHDGDCRTQGLLRSAAVAMACERYRIAHKNWPASLE